MEVKTPIQEIKNWLLEKYPQFSGFVKHTLVSEMCLKYASHQLLNKEEEIEKLSGENKAITKQFLNACNDLENDNLKINRQEGHIKVLKEGDEMFRELLDNDNFLNAIRATLTNDEARKYWRLYYSKKLKK